MPVWVVADQNGSFVFSMNTGLVIPKFAYIKFLDNTGNLCQLCTLYPGQGAMSGIPITQNIDCSKISFSTRGGIPSPGIIVDVVGLAGSVDNNSQVRIDIPLVGTFWVQATTDGSFQFSKNVGNVVIPHQVEVGGVDAQGNFSPTCIIR